MVSYVHFLWPFRPCLHTFWRNIPTDILLYFLKCFYNLFLYFLPLPLKVDGGYVFTPVSLCLSVCLSVCEQNISKSLDGFGRNLVDIGSVTRTSQLKFNSGPNPDLAYQWDTQRKLINLAEVCSRLSALPVFGTCLRAGEFHCYCTEFFLALGFVLWGNTQSLPPTLPHPPFGWNDMGTEGELEVKFSN